MLESSLFRKGSEGNRYHAWYLLLIVLLPAELVYSKDVDADVDGCEVVKLE